jgi:hypothetical protein
VLVVITISLAAVGHDRCGTVTGSGDGDDAKRRLFPRASRRVPRPFLPALSPSGPIHRLAEQLGVHHEALRNWIRQDEPTGVIVMTGQPATRVSNRDDELAGGV